MADSLGWRQKFGVLVPSTNTIVQPDFDDMRVAGVTNHIGRIAIPNMALRDDDDFNRLIETIAAAQLAAVDGLLSMEPDRIVLGISAETFWDGLAASRRLKAELEAHAKRPVVMGAEAVEKALAVYGAKRIAVVTPYQPVGDRNVVRFFGEVGIEVVRIEGLKCESPVAIAHVPETRLRQALLSLDGPDVDALVQVGTNLSMVRLAAEAERWLDKPVLAINTTIFWHALRSAGIHDRKAGFGSLLAEH